MAQFNPYTYPEMFFGIRTDCFAYGDGCCLVLTELSCANCKFYKTREHLAKERKACAARLRRLGLSQKSPCEPAPLSLIGSDIGTAEGFFSQKP